MEPTKSEKIRLIDRVRYQLHKLSESSDNIKTWITVLILLAFVSILLRSWIFLVIAIIFILYLLSERDVQNGRVREYLRKNKDIPNRTQIKQMKEEYIKNSDLK